ncbi:carboxypeptidase Taq [Faunimonas pinastri]|uniref:Metal-dependent carboxypeptidase n=1 Tax=Faunimonas pinastri TaxID=1855383 RepID=A0A1H9IC96_9HYPH|nr:carboxypeptidase M32 [Faunimonas pinastri]SEQ72351.1 carboxypeptidase Taq [Faunimonas pinastri]
MSYARFQETMGRINDVLCTVNLLNWDARTQMPAAGSATRASQIATLTGLARDMAVSDAFAAAMEGALDELSAAPADDLRRRAVESTKARVETLRRIPEALIRESADLKTRAQTLWAELRLRNDFEGFAPTLQRTIAIQREIAAAIGYERHPYDALVGQYEPGMTLARLDTLYGELKAGIRPLLDRALGLEPPRADFLARAYPVGAQRRFGAEIAARMGYDFARGRLDDTVHPFEISFTRNDVRITGRFRETWLPGGLFAVWHEAGHGMYEQGIAPAFDRSAFTTDLVNLYAVGGASFGVHESQSRLWENRVGRSERFWDLHFDALQATFPEQLADVDGLAFWRAVNRAAPSLIRVEADELTYDLHIILRSEIEAALIGREIEVADLPSVWAEKMRAYLGLEVPDHLRGVMQDVHWASGMVGSFPTYTIGNVMSSQFFAAASREPDIAAGLETGEYVPLATWLNENVHRHGRSLTPDRILQQATGSALDAGPYLSDLARKVDRLAATA